MEKKLTIECEDNFNKNVFAPFYYRIRPLIIWKRELKEAFDRNEITEKEYFDRTMQLLKEHIEYINGKEIN